MHIEGELDSGYFGTEIRYLTLLSLPTVTFILTGFNQHALAAYSTCNFHHKYEICTIQYFLSEVSISTTWNLSEKRRF